MKKLFFAFSALALMTACSQDESVEAIQGTEENALREYTLTATWPEADTRTYVVGTTAYWNDDDEVVVYSADESMSATLTIKQIDETNKGKATFSGTVNFTPTKAVYSALSKNETTFTKVSGTYMRSNSPMEGTISSTDGVNSVTFEHTAAMLQITMVAVPNNAGGIVKVTCTAENYSNTVTFKNESGTSGYFSLDFPIPAGANTYDVEYFTTEGTKTGSASCTTPASLIEGQIYSIGGVVYEDNFTSDYELDGTMNPWGNAENSDASASHGSGSSN